MSRSTPAQRRIVAALSGRRRALRRADLLLEASKTSLDRVVDAGVVVRAAPDVYALATRAPELRTRVAVASLWGGEQVTVGGLAALEHLRPTGRRVDQVLVLAPPSFKRAAPPGISLLRTKASFRRFETADARTAYPEDAAVQAWCGADPTAREGLMLDLWRERETYPKDVLASAERWPRVPSRTRLVELAALFGEGVSSYLEHRARTRVFVGDEWDHFEWQTRVSAGSRRFVVDMLSRRAMLAVEFDGARFHAGDQRRRRDLERDALLATLGLATMRLTYEDITRRPQWCRATVRAAVEARTPTGEMGAEASPRAR